MEKDEKDPIKDKYNPKLSLFKKIQLKFNKFTDKLKLNKSLMEDKNVLVSAISTIIVYGIVGSLVSTLFGLSVTLLNFFAIGAGLWLFESKILGFITRILGSVTLIEVKN